MAEECSICEYSQRKMYCLSCANFLIESRKLTLIAALEEKEHIKRILLSKVKPLHKYKQKVSFLNFIYKNTKTQINIAKERLNEINILYNKKLNFYKKKTIFFNNLKSYYLLNLKKFKNLNTNDLNLKCSLNSLHQDLILTRINLCKEVVSIFGLKVRKKSIGKSKEDIKISFIHFPEFSPIQNNQSIYSLNSSDDYLINNHSLKNKSNNIINGFNSISHETLNAVLERVIYFVILISYYLGIKLPYELIPPKKSYPSSIRGPDGLIRFLLLPNPIKDIPPLHLEEFVQGLAMLIVDIVYLAQIEGVHLEGINEVLKIGKILLTILQPAINANIKDIKDTTNTTTNYYDTNNLSNQPFAYWSHATASFCITNEPKLIDYESISRALLAQSNDWDII